MLVHESSSRSRHAISRRLLLAALGAAALSVAAAAPARAEIPVCVGQGEARTVHTGLGVLESLAIGNSGRLYLSAAPTGFADPSSVLLGIDRPGGEPRTIAQAGAGPGGLAFKDRKLIWGFGNTAENGATGDTDPRAGLYEVDPVSGKRRVYAEGLGMANGVAKAPNGAIFASNDFGELVNRVSSKGRVKVDWARVPKGNGMAVSPNGGFLFVNQTFVTPSTIARVEIANPANVTTYATIDPSLGNVILDGLTIDRQGTLYAAGWATGSVYKIPRGGSPCAIPTGIAQLSNLAFGHGRSGFRGGNLYAIGFGGQVVEIPGATWAALPD